MQITELPATPMVLPSGQIVSIATQLWALERWEGEADPPELKPWNIKPRFSVNGTRSCAELAIVDHLRRDGWDGVWVQAFGAQELRRDWFPARAFRTLAEAGAPGWAVKAFGDLRAVNGGKLSGFFDVFAWREPDEIRFIEAKVGPDRIRATQRKFVETALRFHGREQFTIIVIDRQPPPVPAASSPSAR